MLYLKRLFFIIICSNFLSCISSDEKKEIKKFNGYTINGFNYTDSDSIFLLNNNLKPLKKVKIKGTKISLKGKITNPEIAYLQLNKQSELHPLVLENNVYNVLFSNNKATILGSSLNNKLSDYQHFKDKLSLEKSKLHTVFSNRTISLRNYLDATDSIRKVEKLYFLNFIKKNSNNLLGLHLLKQEKLSSKEIYKIQDLIKNSTNTEIQNYLTNLKKETVVAEAVAKIENRPLAKEFSGTNLNRRITRLSQVKRGKKAVLIDFWASWCGPCRELSPRIRNLYYKYRKKGFDIVTVSQDRSINAWEVGVYDDGMENWNHIYDDDNHIAKMYGVRGLPHMTLLDNKGRIIKNKITIDKLEAELKKIFK